MTDPSKQNNNQKEKNSIAVQLAKITAVQAVLVALIAMISSVITGVLSYEAGIKNVIDSPKVADAANGYDSPDLMEPPPSPKNRGNATDKEPIIIVMDSHNTEAVYGQTMKRLFGSNTDDISEIIDDIYGSGNIRREATNPAWKREESIIAQEPDLIIIHKSAFYDYKLVNDRSDLDKLVDVLDSIVRGTENTHFLVYSSGFCNTAGEQDLYTAGTQELVRRIDNFSDLKDKVHYFGVCYAAHEDKEIWKNDTLRRMFKQRVKDILQPSS